MTTTRHVSFSVTNLERTVEFYIDVLGLPILIQFRNKYHTLGDTLFGTRWGNNHPQADLKTAFVQLTDLMVQSTTSGIAGGLRKAPKRGQCDGSALQ